MFAFTEDEKAYLIEMRALTTDSQGQDVLVGLSREETEVYVSHSRAFLRGDRDRDNRDIYLQLHEKHERMRLEVIGTEHYLRTQNPSRQ